MSIGAEMVNLIYTTICSLDGYFEDADGRFDWAAPDEQVHAFVNELERPIGTCLYGRRVYETMVFWETVDTESEPAVIKDYASSWRAAEKIVYSRTLETPSSAKTRIERELEPDAVRELTRASATDISIGGGELAGQALAAGLVTRCVSSSARSSSAMANALCPTMFGRHSNCSTSTASRAASSISGIASAADRPVSPR
jgi:dihydrofolate reductase